MKITIKREQSPSLLEAMPSVMNWRVAKITIYSLLIMVSTMFVSCRGNDDKSDAFGNFEAEETIISSEMTGKVINLNVQQGQQINKGDLIAVIDTTRIALEIKQLKAQRQAVAVKRINLQAQIGVEVERISNLRITQERLHNLFKDNAATQQQVDDVDGQMRLLEKQMASLKTQNISIDSEMTVIDAQLEVLRNNLEKSFITSPMQGWVLEKYVEAGEIVLTGKPVIKLADLSRLDLKVFVSGAQLPMINLGQQVEVLIDRDRDSNQSLSGIVTWISSEAEFTPKIIQTKEERVKLVYAVKVRVENDGRLKIGMPGEIKIN